MKRKVMSLLLSVILIISFIPPSFAASKEVLGFYVGQEYTSLNGTTYKIPSSYDTAINNSEQISMVAGFWFRLSPNGNGDIETDSEYNNQYNKNQLLSNINSMKANNVKVLALIHNMLYSEGSSYGRQMANQLFNSQANTNNFIAQLESILKEYNLDGVNIDIEAVYTSDRDAYTNFIKTLKDTLGVKGYIITVSIPAKNYDSPSNTYSYPFDYEGIGKYADRVAIMTYDEHGAWSGSGAGPIASVDWQEGIIKYALTKIPKEKILLGIPTYGFDWSDNTYPKYLTYDAAIKNADKVGANIQHDEATTVPYYKYSLNGVNHQAWFEDAYSIGYKLDLVNKYDLAGIAIWRLGMEDPAIWNVIKSEINVEKYYDPNDPNFIFYDVKGHWAENDIMSMFRSKYVVGVTNYSFAPDANITRAQFATMLARVLGITRPSDNYVSNFSDSVLSNHWAKDSILAMAERGYIGGFRGYNGNYYFRPDDKITRAQMASIINRILNQTASSNTNIFNDIYSHWAYNDILNLENLGVVGGITPTTFSPDANSTRAQAAVMIYRILDKLN